MTTFYKNLEKLAYNRGAKYYNFALNVTTLRSTNKNYNFCIFWKQANFVYRKAGKCKLRFKCVMRGYFF